MARKITDITPKKDRRDWRWVFLGTLAETGNTSAACVAARISRNQAYAHRRRFPRFAAKWDEALETACDFLELEARRRALQGTVKPVFHKGIEIGGIREYSDTLTIFLLKAHRPEKFRDNFDLQRLVEQLAAAQSGPRGKAGRRKGRA